MNIGEFEQKVRQCIYQSDFTFTSEDGMLIATSGKVLVEYQNWWNVRFVDIQGRTLYGTNYSTLEDCVMLLAREHGVRYFPGIIPTKQQFITTVESYLGTSEVDYKLTTRGGDIHYSAYYAADCTTTHIAYTIPVRRPWHISVLHNQSGLSRTGGGDSLEEAVDESNT